MKCGRTSILGSRCRSVSGLARHVSVRWVAIGYVLASCLFCMTAASAARTPGEVAVGEVLRDATLTGLNGPSRKISDFRGKPLIINVWASWCGPCRMEMASLERLAWRDPIGQFNVIGISTDDYPENANAFLKQSNATINHFVDHALQMENMLGASTIPLTVLVDAQGRVVDKVYGAQQWDGPEAVSLIRRTFRNPKILSSARTQ